MFEVLRRDDVTVRYVCLVQGLEDSWVPVGTTDDVVTASSVAVLADDSLNIQPGRMQPFVGMASSGRLTLSLLDTDGYISSLLSSGTETVLTDDLDPADNTISVADNTALPASGEVFVHRETLAYTGKRGTGSLTGVTHNQHDHCDTYTPEHLITMESATTLNNNVKTVRVGTTPLYLEGRIIQVFAVAIDPSGNAIEDSDGEDHWELWRGVITAIPPSATGAGYDLKAETLERLIQDSPPASGFSGRLMSGEWTPDYGTQYGAQLWSIHDTPLWIARGRSVATISLVWDFVNDTTSRADYAIDVLEGGHGKWMTHTQISAVINGAVSNINFNLLTWEDGDYGTMWAADVYAIAAPAMELGSLTITIVPAAHTVWRQLGFLSRFEQSISVDQAYGQHVLLWATEPPATIYIDLYDDEIPVLASGPVTGTSGTVDIDGEVVYYGNTDTSQSISGVPCVVLRECVRGYANTTPGRYAFRIGADYEPPEVTPCYAVGGGDTVGSPSADQSVWVSLLKILTGTTGKYTNGEYDDFPGLGIPTEHIDVEAISTLALQPPAAGAFAGKVDDVRGWLSDALALEGYSLVSRPTVNGFLLSPVRNGAASTSEEVLTVDIIASAGVQLVGGLDNIINRITIGAGDNQASFLDEDAIDLFGVRQKLEFDLPLADDLAGLVSLSAATMRIFAIAGHRRYLTVKCSIAPEGRFVSPGDIVSLTFPNTALSGSYRVMEASTPLRGSGTIKISAVRTDGWTCQMFAPQSAVVSVDGLTITLTTGDGQWFKEGADVWVYDPSDITDGYTRTIASIVGDVLTLDSVASLTAGDYVEFDDYTSSNTETRYAWLVDDTYAWGD